jgi:hypothetical protein
MVKSREPLEVYGTVAVCTVTIGINIHTYAVTTVVMMDGYLSTSLELG